MRLRSWLQIISHALTIAPTIIRWIANYLKAEERICKIQRDQANEESARRILPYSLQHLPQQDAISVTRNQPCVTITRVPKSVPISVTEMPK